jgi:steroid 5-alpha reductase family enzyme
VGGIVAYLLFFIAGVGFGYAALGKWRWVPMLFPGVLGLFALMKYGPDASVLIRLVVALVITAFGVLLGAAIDARGDEAGEQPRYA